MQDAAINYSKTVCGRYILQQENSGDWNGFI
jgi:hypothetical protein